MILTLLRLLKVLELNDMMYEERINIDDKILNESVNIDNDNRETIG